MTVRLRDEETDDFVTLIWTGDRVNERLPNRAGFEVPHVTRCVSGRVRFEFFDGRRSVELGPGEEIILPTPHVGYEVVAVEVPIEMRCAYPKTVERAVEEIEHLRGYKGREYQRTSGLVIEQDRNFKNE